MLKNKTNSVRKFRYNGKAVELAPGESIDVRDFDVSNANVKGAEKHLMTKHVGVFEQSATIAKYKDAEGYLERIKELEKKVEELSQELVRAKESDELSKQKFIASQEECNAAIKSFESIKTESTKWAAERKDYEDEIESLRLSMASGKPASKKKK